MNVQCNFPQYSSRTRATTSPKDKKCGPFRVIGRRKKHANDRTRPVSTRDGPLDQPNKQNVYMGQPRAVFFHELGRLRPILSTIQADAGPIGALKKGGLTLTPRLFGTLGRISNPKPMVIHHSRSFVPGICSVCIRRAAQMSEQRGAQSQRSQSKWTQIDGRNCTVRP